MLGVAKVLARGFGEDEDVILESLCLYAGAGWITRKVEEETSQMILQNLKLNRKENLLSSIHGKNAPRTKKVTGLLQDIRIASRLFYNEIASIVRGFYSSQNRYLQLIMRSVQSVYAYSTIFSKLRIIVPNSVRT